MATEDFKRKDSGENGNHLGETRFRQKRLRLLYQGEVVLLAGDWVCSPYIWLTDSGASCLPEFEPDSALAVIFAPRRIGRVSVPLLLIL